MSCMLDEALEAPNAVALQLDCDAAQYDEFGAFLRDLDPRAILTVARGSSDHASSYMAYLIMAKMGRLVTSLPMSLVTLYQANFDGNKLLAMAFSQSGQSPDLVVPMQSFSEKGACTAAFVNTADSPLAKAAKWVFPLYAGQENSVAATKSFITQMVAGARVVSVWQQDLLLESALMRLPQVLTQAAQTDWSVAVDTLKEVEKLFVIGRGTGLAIAQEAALKLKEVCAIQAEAFSGAEMKHGPMALIDYGYPLLIFAPRGPAQDGLLELAAEMRTRGASILLAAPAGTPGANLVIVETASEELDPISMIQSFYIMVESLARVLGRNPDEPRHLKKITRTY